MLGGSKQSTWALRLPVNLYGWTATAFLLAALQMLSALEVLPRDAVASPASAIAALWELIGMSSFWSECGATLTGWGLGLVISAVIGIPLGMLFGSSRLLESVTRAVLEFVRPIPVVAFVPLAMLELGTGTRTAVLLVVIGTVWPVLLQTLHGVAALDETAAETARLFGISRWRRLLLIRLPSASLFIATGIRIASSLALVLAVTAELIVGAPGLGSAIAIAGSAGAIPRMYGLVVATGTMGLLLNWFLLQAQRSLIPWARASEVLGERSL